MKSARQFAIVLVTAPDLQTARALAGAVLRARLAACVNILPKVESHYWWKGKIETGAEVMLVMKSTKLKLPALEQCVLKHHPYDTPEFLALPLAGGHARYLAWLTASVQPEEV